MELPIDLENYCCIMKTTFMRNAIDCIVYSIPHSSPSIHVWERTDGRKQISEICILVIYDQNNLSTFLNCSVARAVF